MNGLLVKIITHDKTISPIVSRNEKIVKYFYIQYVLYYAIVYC